MEPAFGNRARVAEVLNKRRALTLPMIRALGAIARSAGGRAGAALRGGGPAAGISHAASAAIGRTWLLSTQPRHRWVANDFLQTDTDHANWRQASVAHPVTLWPTLPALPS